MKKNSVGSLGTNVFQLKYMNFSRLIINIKCGITVALILTTYLLLAPPPPPLRLLVCGIR
jgi:hypothetical protein